VFAILTIAYTWPLATNFDNCFVVTLPLSRLGYADLGLTSWILSWGAHQLLHANWLTDPEALAILRGATGVDTIVVHYRELTPEKRLTWLSLAKEGKADGLRFLAQYGDDMLFTTSESTAQDSR